MINLEEHKVYIENRKMDMVPYTVAVQALKEVLNTDAGKYTIELESAINQLRDSLNNVNLDD